MFNFSSLRSHPKVTLPSVDNGWLINNSIIKDPPKSIHTRRIDKVGSTQIVTDMVEDNGSRICGNIMKFPRGVNPAAEYSAPLGNGNGVGSNSTIRDNSNNPVTLRSDPGYSFRGEYGRGSGGYLSRRIMMYGGAFRPPMYTQEQLLPLSRQPRVRTSCVTHPEMIDYSTRTNNIDMQKNIKDVVIQPPIDPTLRRIIERNQKQHNTDDFIQDKLLSENVSSGVRPRDITLQENHKCFGTTKIDPTTAYAYTQPCSDTITRDTMLYVMEQPGMNYVHDVLLKQQVLPNISGINKEGESTLGTQYTVAYPRAVRDIVCQPRVDSMLPTEAPNEIQSFVKDDVLNTFNVVNAPHLEHIVARNIIDSNKLDTDKYVHDTILHSNVDAGYGGSNIMNQHLDDMSDYSQIKLNPDMLYVPAYSQRLGNAEKDIHIHYNKPGKKLNIRQYETNSGRAGIVSDEYINTERRARLQPKISALTGFNNVGYKPIINNGQNPGGIKNQINDGVMKDKLKRVHFDRNNSIHVY